MGWGTGPPAAQAAAEAAVVFREQLAREPAEILEVDSLRALRGTRGAALAIARLDLAEGEVRYAGVGNISGVILDARTGRNHQHGLA